VVADLVALQLLGTKVEGAVAVVNTDLEGQGEGGGRRKLTLCNQVGVV